MSCLRLYRPHLIINEASMAHASMAHPTIVGSIVSRIDCVGRPSMAHAARFVTVTFRPSFRAWTRERLPVAGSWVLAGGVLAVGSCEPRHQAAGRMSPSVQMRRSWRPANTGSE